MILFMTFSLGNGENNFDYSKIKPILTSIEAKTYPARYRMHKYWAKKPYNIVSYYINHYTKKGDIVFDPFCGSGVSAVEALILRRKAIALDLNPVSIFITKMTAISPVNLDNLKTVFTNIEKKVKDKINSYYLLDEKCPKCKSQLTAEITWRGEIDIPLVQTSCPQCGSKNARKQREMKKSEIKVLNQYENEKIPYWYPKDKLIPNSRLCVKEKTSIKDLFSNRNLITTTILFNAIQSIKDELYRDLLKFTFTSLVAQATKMIPAAPGCGGMSWKQHGFWLPSQYREANVWHYFSNRFNKILNGKKETNMLIGDFYKEGDTIKFYTQSATDLGNISNRSIDYVFTDPPYGDSEPYLEESILWNAWLGFDSDFKKEIILTDSSVRPEKRNKTKEGMENYTRMLAESFNEVKKKMKTDRYMTVTFHNRDRAIWASLIRACTKAGFERKKVMPLKASAPSVSQHDRNGALKSDQIIDFIISSKPNGVEKGLPVDIKDCMINSANSVILKLDGATDQEVYDYIIQGLIENDLIHRTKAPKNFDDVKKFLEKKYRNVKGKWFIDPTRLTVWERIGRKNQLRLLIKSFLKDKKEASTDEIYNMLLPQINGGGGTKYSKNAEIIPILRELAHISDKKWRLKKRKTVVKQAALTTDERGLPYISFKEMDTKTAHNEMIVALANLARILKYNIWIGKREQSQKFKNVKLSDICDFEELPIADLTKESERVIKQIDIIWFDENKGPIAAFEIENTTDVQRGVNRFQNLIKIEPETSSNLFIVAPNQRKTKVINELTNPVFIGSPLFIEKKVRYILYEELIRLYKDLQSNSSKLNEFNFKKIELLSESVL